MDNIIKPSKEEQQVALESFEILERTLKDLTEDLPEIEIEETEQRIKVPLRALRLLAEILKATSQGQPISVVPIASEFTTQAAADYLGCSRPHLVKILEEGKIPYTKVGRHRRVLFEDLAAYKKKMKADQKQRLLDMMRKDEETGLYDS